MDLSQPQILWNNVFELFGKDEFYIRVWGSFLVSFLTYWSVGGIFTVVDITQRPAFMKKYKVQENVKSYPVSVILTL